MSGRLIDAEKLQEFLMDGKSREDCLAYETSIRVLDAIDEINSGRLDAQSPTPGQDGLGRIPWNVTFALEYLQGYMGDEPEEARSKLATLAKFINGLVPPSPTSTGERE